MGYTAAVNYLYVICHCEQKKEGGKNKKEGDSSANCCQGLKRRELLQQRTLPDKK